MNWREEKNNNNTVSVVMLDVWMCVSSVLKLTNILACWIVEYYYFFGPHIWNWHCTPDNSWKRDFGIWLVPKLQKKIDFKPFWFNNAHQAIQWREKHNLIRMKEKAREMRKISKQQCVKVLETRLYELYRQ